MKSSAKALHTKDAQLMQLALLYPFHHLKKIILVFLRKDFFHEWILSSYLSNHSIEDIRYDS